MAWWQLLRWIRPTALEVDTSLTKQSKSKLSAQQRRQMLTLRDGGHSLREIAATLGVSHEAVRKVLRRTSGGGQPRQTRVSESTEQTGVGSQAIAEATQAVREVAEFKRAIREVSEDEGGRNLPVDSFPSSYEPDPEAETLAEIRREVYRSPEYREAVRERMLADARGASSRRGDPMDQLLAQVERIKNAASVLGLGGEERGDSVVADVLKAWGQQLLPSVGPLLVAWINRPSVRPSVLNSSQEMHHVPVMPAGSALSTTGAMTAPVDQGAAGNATTVNVSPPVPVPVETEVESAAQSDAMQLVRAVLMELRQFATGMPEEAAIASFNWLLSQEESDGPLAGPANELLGLDPTQLLAVVLAFREDTELGPMVVALERNPAWALQYLVRLRELLAASQEDEDDDSEPAPLPVKPKRERTQRPAPEKGGKQRPQAKRRTET